MGQFNKHYTRLVITVIIVATAYSSFAQTIKGVVFQDSTQIPLTFVNIGILGFNKGVISKEDGSFSINVSAKLENETLRFSMIGYETQDFKISDIKEGQLIVLMTPRTYALQEVVISDYTRNKLKKYGNTKTSKVTTGHSGDGEYGIGFEWGLKIPRQEHPYMPKDVNFNLRFNTVDSTLFRIKIYNIKDGLPDTSLINSDLLLKSYKKQKWVVNDISNQNLVIDEDIIITLEVLRVWYSNKGQNHLFLTHSQQSAKQENFSRNSSQDSWNQNAPGPLALFLSAWEKKN